MPLDTGAVVEGLVSPLTATPARDREPAPTLNTPGDLGQILRAVRLHRGLDLEDLARLTRIRVSYLAAIEHRRLDQLPSRPFALGYVRAYAAALGLDGDLAAARFKVEAPDGAEPLRAPMGVRRETDPRLKMLGLAAAVVVAAIVTWNIAQHLLSKSAPSHRGAAEVAQGAGKPQSASVAGPLSVGAPLPAPAESTTPQPYVTPGLEQALGPSAAEAAAQSAAAAAQAPPVGSPFMRRGAIYGASVQQSAVILQARKGASLVVHGPDGSVYFARQLAAGEAYRAPQIKGLSIDVSDPQKFDVYVGGLLKGPLSGPKTEATDLAGAAADR
jgi:transcriptional regulator with XRE-family HTH domain